MNTTTALPVNPPKPKHGTFAKLTAELGISYYDVRKFYYDGMPQSADEARKWIEGRPVPVLVCLQCGGSAPAGTRTRFCLACARARADAASYRCYRNRRAVEIQRFHLEWKCLFCGCGLSQAKRPIKAKNTKYCSNECKDSAGVKMEKDRLNSNIELRLKKRAVSKRAWEKRTASGKNAAYKKKYHQRPEVRIAKSHRNRIQELIKKGALVKSRSSIKLFGCSVAFLMQHLQKQFRRGMSWNNYGTIWVVDHVIPCASFDLIKPEEQVKCFHFSNLQPLWRTENAIKSDRILPTQPQLILPA